MSSSAGRRGGSFPVRLSINVTDRTSDALDRWSDRTGWSRAELAREALDAGLKLLADRFRKRRERRAQRAATASDDEDAVLGVGGVDDFGSLRDEPRFR